MITFDEQREDCSCPQEYRLTRTWTATDACGNARAPTLVGTLYVPHDQDPHERNCLNPTSVGCRPNQPIPCR